MKKSILGLCLLLIVSMSCFSQQSLDDYNIRATPTVAYAYGHTNGTFKTTVVPVIQQSRDIILVPINGYGDRHYYSPQPARNSVININQNQGNGGAQAMQAMMDVLSIANSGKGLVTTCNCRESIVNEPIRIPK